MKIALVCIAKNEDNYLEEWINYHKKIGFDDIFVYQNNWRFKKYISDVNFIEYDGEIKQLPAYNSFINSYKNDYDWVCFIDVDEFITLKKHKNIKELISDYNDYDSIALNWALFGDNGAKDVIDNNYSVLNRFTKRGKLLDKHIKTICKLKSNPIYTNPHSSNIKWVATNGVIGHGPFNEKHNDTIAYINHYFCKTPTEFLEKISRGRSDTKDIRDFSDYEKHNINEIDDYTALDFYKTNK